MIKIIADSTCDIPQEEAKKLGITVIPLTININGKVYRDGVDITNAEFYKELASSKTLPTTSQVNPTSFEEAIRPFYENGDDVIVITLASKLSATYQSANIAKNEFDEGRVFVVDSCSVSLGIALLVKYAIKLCNETNLSAKEIADILQKNTEKIQVFAVINTLEYLVKGGRLNSKLAVIGGILNLLPVVQVKDGEITPIKKVRGHNAGMKALKELCENYSIDFEKGIAIGNADAQDRINAYYEYLKDSFGNAEIINMEIGSAIGTHSGPGVIGIAFFNK